MEKWREEGGIEGETDRQADRDRDTQRETVSAPVFVMFTSLLR